MHPVPLFPCSSYESLGHYDVFLVVLPKFQFFCLREVFNSDICFQVHDGIILFECLKAIYKMAFNDTFLFMLYGMFYYFREQLFVVSSSLGEIQICLQQNARFQYRKFNDPWFLFQSKVLHACIRVFGLCINIYWVGIHHIYILCMYLFLFLLHHSMYILALQYTSVYINMCASQLEYM